MIQRFFMLYFFTKALWKKEEKDGGLSMRIKGVNKVFYKKLSEKAIFDVLFEEALELLEEKGWLAVPFVIEKEGSKYLKRPVGRWSRLKDGEVSLQEYWQSISTKEELSVSGIGIITGKASGVTVLDIDDPKKFEEKTGLKLEKLLMKTLAVKTIGKGYHLYTALEKLNLDRRVGRALGLTTLFPEARGEHLKELRTLRDELKKELFTKNPPESPLL